MKKGKIVKNRNGSRLPWEEATAHSLGITAVVKMHFICLTDIVSF